MRIQPVSQIRGTADLPGDKSIAHRYALLGAMASGQTVIEKYPQSQDCLSTIDCIRALGVDSTPAGDNLTLDSPGWRNWKTPEKTLEAGNSGTTIRLLSGPLAGAGVRARIDGDESLRRRPMKRILLPLREMGALITAREESFPPLEIQGRTLQGIRYRTPVASAQLKSCLLLAGVTATGVTQVTEHAASRDHTELALPVFGVPVERSGLTARVTGPMDLTPARVRVPGDISAASFLVAATLMLPGSRVRMPGVGLNPTRAALLDLLAEAGATIRKENIREDQGEPIGDLVVERGTRSPHLPTLIAGDQVVRLIDEIPVLAVLAAALGQTLEVRDAGELRVKESDRISRIVDNLNRIGVSATESATGFHIPAGSRITGGDISTGHDHRIAMAFGTAGLASRDGVEIDRPEDCAVSFPGFFKTLDSLAATPGG